MAKIKSFIKTLVPPVVLSVLHTAETKVDGIKSFKTWSGDYVLWKNAAENCTGYDTIDILEKCKTALLKVKNGEAVYERDSVLFGEMQYSWGLLAGLQKATLENDGKLCVLDFGGSLGSTFYQNKNFLKSLKNLQWCIVEQPHFVDCGKENFENENLLFYYTIEDCLLKHKPNVLLLSSVLQYLEKPYDWINKFVNLDIPYIIIDRTAFIDSDIDILTVQKVPASIYAASYPAWFFGNNLLKFFMNTYKKLAQFDNGFTNPILLNGLYTAHWKGVIFKK